jgi:ribose 5-phosphate isomerase A
VRFAWRPIAERIAHLGCVPKLRQRPDGHPYETDEGNYILDCAFGAIDDPRSVAQLLDAMPGVMEHGLFVDIAHVLLVGQESDVLVFSR